MKQIKDAVHKPSNRRMVVTKCYANITFNDGMKGNGNTPAEVNSLSD